MIKSTNIENKILLVLLPFWDPLIPPAGISCLKSFLLDKGYNVKTVDANVNDSLKGIYHDYFNVLKSHVPEDKYGNFFKIGHDVLRNHLMAHLKLTDENREYYLILVKELIHKIFYVQVGDDLVSQLINIAHHFYSRLETYFISLLEKEKPDVLGISVYSDTLPASLFAFKLAKAIFPQMKTVMGGGVFASDLAVGSPNFQTFLEETPYIDHIIVGEGEILFFKLLQGEFNPSQRVLFLESINKKSLDINSVKIPDFSDFELHHYPYLMAYTSRSCPFQCRFCTEFIYWGSYRKKSAPQVARELNQLYQTYGIQLFLMSDSLLNPVLKELALELLKTDIRIYWDGYVRADRQLEDLENTLLFRQAGFYRARLGIESGSREVLQLMNKKITLEQIKATISSLAYAGIKTTTYWVIGYPGETETHFRETLDLLTEVADDIYEADCSPFWYYPTAQVHTDKWGSRVIPLYSEASSQLLITKTWIVDCEPQRNEIYQRMWRFVNHCSKLGIPNPYSMEGIVKADKRWRELHQNAVPPLVSFKKDTCIDDKKNIKQLIIANEVPVEDDDFNF
jgi:hypothetical protein